MSSFYDRVSALPNGGAALASARLRRRVLRLLHEGLQSSGLTQAELARRVGVRRSAANQVLRGDGNVRMDTLSDYLFALGLEADLVTVKAGELRRSRLENRRPRYFVGGLDASEPQDERRFSTVWTVTASGGQGVGEYTMTSTSPVHPDSFLEDPKPRMTVDIVDQQATVFGEPAVPKVRYSKATVADVVPVSVSGARR